MLLHSNNTISNTKHGHVVIVKFYPVYLVLAYLFCYYRSILHKETFICCVVFILMNMVSGHIAVVDLPLKLHR